MLPTGHIAAGYLTAFGVVKILKPDLDPHQINQLLIAGAVWGFAPDLDEFWFFFKNKTFLVAPEANKYHRNYISHAPVLWLIAGFLIFFAADDPLIKYLGLLLWLGSWSHFLLDSIEYGIMWLWPFTDKLYALSGAGIKPFVIEEKNFFKHSFKFLHFYSKRVSFYLEIVIILLALIILL